MPPAARRRRPHLHPAPPPPPNLSSAALRDFLFRAPERERGPAPSPAKFSSLKKRQHVAASQEAATTPADAIAFSDVAGAAAVTQISGREMILHLSAENTDLKHQISVLCAQMVTSQASMTAQLSGLSSQVIQLSQQLAKSESMTNTAPTSATTKTYPSVSTTRTYTAPAPGPPPPSPSQAEAQALAGQQAALYPTARSVNCRKHWHRCRCQCLMRRGSGLCPRGRQHLHYSH